MYGGSLGAWGAMYGGAASRANCSALPRWPTEASAMKAAGDDLVSLCQYSFDKKVRLEPGGISSNPTIRDMARVRCPDALVEATQLQRSDDPEGYSGPSLPGFPNGNTTCQQSQYELKYCLTRMMDCCKPSAGWTNNIKPDLVVAGRRVVQTCTADGYTRIDVQCGCFDCNC